MSDRPYQRRSGSSPEHRSAVAPPAHGQLPAGPEAFEVTAQHVLDEGEGLRVVGGRLEKQVVRPRAHDAGARGQPQQTAVGLAVDRGHPGLAAEMGEQLLGVARGVVGGDDGGRREHGNTSADGQTPNTSMAPSWSNSKVTLPPAT